LLEVYIGGTPKENEVARKYIELYGYDKVRGGVYLKDKPTKIRICSWLKQISI